MVFFKKYLPSITFVIASSALSFQIFILEPWHHKLDVQFKQLKQEQEHSLKDYHESKLEKMLQIEQRLDKLKKQLAQVDAVLQKKLGRV